ncbi:MAG: hypothetical protein A3I63_10750 [Betaproteobacteria bacterium RIFCSPLOWO2_02_FULL_66_14]|nr:MAG: hypothetical protein A3I63_10750 [Betaproteobacteria bacterium RIFCSPLOWO2_02_FULL_66_14]
MKQVQAFFGRAAGPGFAARIAAFALAALLAPALALAQAGGAAKANPRLASLGIELWPEYDRAGATLVILKAEIAQEVKLPATVSLRIPASAGGPSAVAFSRTPSGGLMNLQFEQQQAADAITLRFEIPERFFHIELYQPFPTVLPARSFTYTWPGDLAADRVVLVVQEPAASTGLEVQPKLERSATGEDGLRYVSAELTAQPAGKALPITARYTKADLRTSVDIMKPKSAAGAAAAAPAPGAPASAGLPFPVSVIALLVVALLAIGGALLFFALKRQPKAPTALPHGACTRCGAPRRSADRYCGKCGAKLA